MGTSSSEFLEGGPSAIRLLFYTEGPSLTVRLTVPDDEIEIAGSVRPLSGAVADGTSWFNPASLWEPPSATKLRVWRTLATTTANAPEGALPSEAVASARWRLRLGLLMMSG